ncbi:choline transport protein [Rutstroemia sp. NJR-2017a BVV2]|nr:choline transport protein [Rutstroemia sp. NJR-2017a BVV2]
MTPGPVVNIATWMGLTGMILAVIVRIGSKLFVLRRVNTDDALILITMYGYASQLFYIPTLCFGKLSTLFYLRALTPDSGYAVVNRAIEIFVMAWAVSAEVAIVFQCGVPEPFAILSNHCFSPLAFWDVIGSLDIFTDFAIVCLPIILVWELQMPFKRKAVVFMAFGTRIFILPLSIIRLYVLSHDASPSLPDQTLVSYHNYLWTTIQVNSAIFLACLPFLKPFMEAMSSGALVSTVKPMDSSYGNHGSKLSTILSSRSAWKSSKPKSSKTPRHLRDLTSLQDEDFESITPITTPPNSNPSKSPIFGIQYTNKASNENGEVLGTLRPDGAMHYSHIRRSTPDDQDQAERSTIGSDQMIIRRTTEWDVREDFEDDRIGRHLGDEDKVEKRGQEDDDWGRKGTHYVP